MSKGGKIESYMESLHFVNIWGLLWALIKINVLTRRWGEEVEINWKFPMRWL